MDENSSKHSTADSSSGSGSEAELDDRTMVVRIPKRHRGRMSANTRAPGYKYIIKYVDDPLPPATPRVKTSKELKAERIAAREKRKAQEKERRQLDAEREKQRREQPRRSLRLQMKEEERGRKEERKRERGR